MTPVVPHVSNASRKPETRGNSAYHYRQRNFHPIFVLGFERCPRPETLQTLPCAAKGIGNNVLRCCMHDYDELKSMSMDMSVNLRGFGRMESMDKILQCQRSLYKASREGRQRHAKGASQTASPFFIML